MTSLPDLDTLPETADFGMILEEADPNDDPDPEYVPRQRNMGKLQHRKFTGYDQRLPMVIYGFREQTVHGTSTFGTPHTLLVLRWALQQRSPNRRFKSASIRAHFRTTHPHRSGRGTDAYYDPNVVGVAPNGTYTLLATPVAVSHTRAAETGVDAGIEYFKGGAKKSYELTESVERTDHITINGTAKSEYTSRDADAMGDPDRCNVAEWQLFENTAAKSGLPTFFRTAVLLERRDGDGARFTCEFTIRAKVDGGTDARMGLRRFVGRVPRDEPIIFAPEMEEDGPLVGRKGELDCVELGGLCGVVMFRSGLERSEGEEKKEGQSDAED